MTVRRWILDTLIAAGIDPKQYGLKNPAYSTRHAASSAMRDAGMSIDEIMRKAGWTNASSFVVHYNLPIRHFKGKQGTTSLPTSLPKKILPGTSDQPSIRQRHINTISAEEARRATSLKGGFYTPRAKAAIARAKQHLLKKQISAAEPKRLGKHKTTSIYHFLANSELQPPSTQAHDTSFDFFPEEISNPLNDSTATDHGDVATENGEILDDEIPSDPY